MKTELIQSALDKLLSMFRDQQFPAEIGCQIIRRRKGDHPLPSDSWSAGNRLIMLASGTRDARGFSQWRDVGRRVKPGSKALYIAAPITRKYKSEIGQVSAEAETDGTAIVIVGFRWIPVFRLEDTAGAPLADADYKPEVLPPMFAAAEKLGVSVKWQPFDGRALGRYRPSSKEIILSDQTALTFFHELMHHLDGQIEPIRPGRLCEAELIAELGGSVLCALQGITGYEAGSYRYLQMYAEGKEPEAVLKSVMAVAARVEQLVGAFLDAVEEGQRNPGHQPQEPISASA